MDNTTSELGEPSVRQVEFLNYVPAVMVYDAEVSDLDIDALQKAVAFFVKRHESVRTIFPVIDGEIKQLILPYDDERFLIEFVDVTREEQPYWHIKNSYFKRTETEFINKQKDPLIKFLLLKLESDKYKFLLLIDHIICDAWSMTKIIKEEIVTFYNNYLEGGEPDIQPLKLQLRDYCQQQRIWHEKKKNTLSAFWKEKLLGYDNQFDVNIYYIQYLLRTNQPVTATTKHRVKNQKQFLKYYEDQKSYLYTFKIAGQTFANVKRIAEINKCTISAIIYASLYIFLYCYTGKKKILMAAFIADRFTPAYRFIIGLLIGTVYFPREISDTVTIREFIDKTLYDVLTNCQNIIFSHDRLGLDERKLNSSFDFLINYIKLNTDTPEIAELNQKHLAILGSPYILESMIHEYEDSFVFYWKYKPLFDKKIIEDMEFFYHNVLDFITENTNKTIGDARQSLSRQIT